MDLSDDDVNDFIDIIRSEGSSSPTSEDKEDEQIIKRVRYETVEMMKKCPICEKEKLLNKFDKHYYNCKARNRKKKTAIELYFEENKVTDPSTLRTFHMKGLHSDVKFSFDKFSEKEVKLILTLFKEAL